MAPIMDIPNEKDYERASKILELAGIKYNSQKEKQIAELDKSNWIYVPQEEGKKFKTLSGYSFDASPGRLAYSPAVEKVATELNKTLENNLEINYKNTSKDSLGREFIGNNNWKESMMINQFLGAKSPNMKEELDYLHLLYLGSQNEIKVHDVSGKRIDSKLCEKLLIDKIKAQEPWRAEYIDADYKTGEMGLEVHSDNIFDKQGNIVDYKSEVLDGDTLMEDKRIDAVDYLTKNHTSQGQISEKVKSGNILSRYPRSDNNSVARLFADRDGANLDSFRNPSGSDPVLWVGTVAPRKQ